MRYKPTLLLNIICVIGFILYGIAIILYTVVLNQRWGNAAIDLGIQILGPIFGTIVHNCMHNFLANDCVKSDYFNQYWRRGLFLKNKILQKQ